MEIKKMVSENQLKDFYNNHYKTADMLEWYELSNKQKKTLENSLAYWSYNLTKVVGDFKNKLLRLIPFVN